METTSSPENKARRSVRPAVIRSESVEAKFGFKSSHFASSSSFKSSSMASSSTGLFRRSSSPTYVNVHTSPNHFGFPIDQSKKNTCMCSPTTHPGSFRCSIHRRANNHSTGGSDGFTSSSSNILYARRSAMTTSLDRIRPVERYLVKHALAARTRRSSSHQQGRRSEFHPQPTRLSVMSTANEAS